jgi:prophage DNA circulation protein
MSVFSENLDSASFRDVPFLIPAELSTEGGRKKVVHEFVNSNRRAVEDLGRYQKVFRIRGIITNNDGQYFERRNALINALEKSTAGVLSHPFFGKIKVVPDKYTVTESFSSLGRADFSMKFFRAEDRIAPLADAFTAFNVRNQEEVVIEFVGEEIVEKFRVSAAFPFNFSASTNLLEKIGNEFDSITNTFQRGLAEIDNFSRELIDFRNSILRLVNLPQQLVNSMTNLYNSVVLLAETPAEAFLTLEKFFPFGDTDPLIPLTTAERIEKLANRTLLNQFMQVGALALAYERTVNIDFFTIREIDVYSEKLNAQYNKVFPGLTNEDLASALTELRVTANEFLDIQRLNVKKIVDFETGPTTAQALTYRLYGSVDDAERLALLNDIKDVDFVSGQVEVFR